MSDNKDYIMQKQENGSVNINEDVIVAITASAVKEVEGVVDLYGNFGSDIADRLGMKNPNKGIKLVLNESSVEVECSIIALYGKPVIEIAKNVQNAVRNAIESMTGLKVDFVNVNVSGISVEK